MPTKKTIFTSLSTWLFKKPVLFATYFFIIAILITGIFSVIKAWSGIGIESYIFLLTISFILSAYYFIIKKLPHEDMSRNDLIAISNGYSLISIIIPLILLGFIGTDDAVFERKIIWLYLLHPILFTILAFVIILVVLYLFGAAISCIYAKYKRARTVGFSKWKIICSMPFTFLLMWMPGYLISEKSTKTNLEIKSKWYSEFNNWVVSNSYNVLFTFLLFLLFRNIYSGLPVLILTISLLIIYALWNLKYKKDLIKNINRGYALTAVLINITIIIFTLIFI